MFRDYINLPGVINNSVRIEVYPQAIKMIQQQ